MTIKSDRQVDHVIKLGDESSSDIILKKIIRAGKKKNLNLPILCDGSISTIS
jgi:hypothetical protein